MRWATKEDWALQRPLIQRLYLHEGKPLSEVMHIMETEQEFRATSKMYKQRFDRWNWKKRPKDSGYRTSGHRNPRRPTLAATMVRSRLHTGRLKDVKEGLTGDKPNLGLVIEEAPFSRPSQTLALMDVPPSPKDPEMIRITNATLKYGRDYILGSFDAGTFVLPNRHSRLISSKPGGDRLVPLRDLFTQHYKACFLIDRGSVSEAMHVLNVAYGGLDAIVLAEHPRALPTVLALVLYLRARGRFEMGAVLLRQFSYAVCLQYGPNHPFALISSIFMNLNPCEFDHLLALGCQHGNHFYRLFLGQDYDFGQDSLRSAKAILHDIAYGRQKLADPVGVQAMQWPDMLDESLHYKGRFDMAGRVALLIERSPRVESQVSGKVTDLAD